MADGTECSAPTPTTPTLTPITVQNGWKMTNRVKRLPHGRVPKGSSHGIHVTCAETVPRCLDETLVSSSIPTMPHVQTGQLQSVFHGLVSQ
ncbi:hypothetical protein JZ751_022140 [Albula glossodonta]|uniref:Uncharacterized protein n=1 Tax=Albula glossodonta TaxID=121402 RepID=A0A8T2NIE2_9TELE|nr:hypothetical protein JZ751_022140 [Albula glossodonta]